MDGKISAEEIPLRRAMNLVLRDSYVEDCQRALAKWNETLEKAGVAYPLKLPSQRFNRQQGLYAGMPFDPEGNLLAADVHANKKADLLPTAAHYAYLEVFTRWFGMLCPTLFVLWRQRSGIISVVRAHRQG